MKDTSSKSGLGGLLLQVFIAERLQLHIPADHEHQFRFNVNTISGPM
ncbi:hypothetical protein [Aeromonas taiwanensis]